MNGAAQNPFATTNGAERYARGRPFHHPGALDRIFEKLRRSTVSRALDVAAGTGLSTVALAERAEVVVGVDSTEAMIRLARPAANVVYAVAKAEGLPFLTGVFELMTVSSGVHWFDQQAFFAEVQRVLKPKGYLAIYDHFFDGAKNEPDINAWLQHGYLERYPTPPRGATVERQVAAPPDFTEIATFEYDDPIQFSQQELVAYLLSQSNTIRASIEGEETMEETTSWLMAQTASWFQGAQQLFLFRGTVRCLRYEA
jgi:SAM-dependent methyltransferase